jgi:hypothetical protein
LNQEKISGKKIVYILIAGVIVLLIVLLVTSFILYKNNSEDEFGPMICGDCQYLDSVENVCMEYFCCDWNDCDDGNPDTDNICINPGSFQADCENPLLNHGESYEK